MELPKKLTSAPIYDYNPFIDDMVGELKIKRKTQILKASDNSNSVLLINNDGEHVGHSAFMRQLEVDEDKFAKIFISQLGALWDLKKTSLRVLTYILATVKPNTDIVYFDWKDCMEFCKLKSTKVFLTDC
jgi:hypothetical protein